MISQGTRKSLHTRTFVLSFQPIKKYPRNKESEETRGKMENIKIVKFLEVGTTYGMKIGNVYIKYYVIYLLDLDSIILIIFIL
jgi:hypothetical protein